MALLHWYIVPIAWELKFNPEVVKNFAMFSNIVEYAMTGRPQSQADLQKLYLKAVDFLKDFERLYVGEVLRHGRDVHPTWVKLSTETLSNKGSGF